MRPSLKDYFIPHEGNNFAPHSLQKAAMLAMVLLVVLSFAAVNVQSLLWVSSTWLVSTVLPGVIIDLTNDERQTKSLGTLRHSPVLDEAAQLKAEDMAKNEYFAHYSPAGVTPWHWFSLAGYNFAHAGENLAIHFTDSEEVVDAWMNSPSHRENILDGDYTEIGIGTAKGKYEGFETLYVVQLFGTPAAGASRVTSDASVEESVTPPPSTDNVVSEVLAEAVSVSEVVEIKELEPVPVAVSLPTSTDSVPQDESEVVQLIPETQTTTTVNEEGVIVYSDFMATSTGAVPAIVSTDGAVHETTPHIIALAAKPHQVLQILYILIGTFVFLCLSLSVFIEIKRQQPLQIAYGTGLLAIMALLFYIHLSLTAGAVVL